VKILSAELQAIFQSSWILQRIVSQWLAKWSCIQCCMSQ